MSEGEIFLTKGPITLGLRPEWGGAIARLDYRAADGKTHGLLRAGPTSGGPDTDPRDTACFPLFPFSNRIAQAELHFDGQIFPLPVNYPPEPHCLHGDGWHNPWEIGQRGDDFIELTYRSDRLGPPFDYAASQRFTLAEDHLRVDLSLTNKGTRSMPAGTGLHSYFDRTPDTRLTANLPGFWMADDSLIPYEHMDVPGALDFRNPRLVDSVTVDANFTGWDGKALIDWPDRPIACEVAASDSMRNVVIYIPPGQPYFCFEPVSNANDAFNRGPEHYERDGVTILEPGESLQAWATYRAVLK